MNLFAWFAHVPAMAPCMIGARVTNLQGDSLGAIKAIVLTALGGRVAYVVVAYGGFLGMGQKLFAIPFGSFTYDAKDHNYVLALAPASLKEAPGIDGNHWPIMANALEDRDAHYD
jgi:hypothetical protein